MKNSIRSPKTSFKEENSQKDKEKGKNTLKGNTTRPTGVQNSAKKHCFCT